MLNTEVQDDMPVLQGYTVGFQLPEQYVNKVVANDMGWTYILLGADYFRVHKCNDGSFILEQTIFYDAMCEASIEAFIELFEIVNSQPGHNNYSIRESITVNSVKEALEYTGFKPVDHVASEADIDDTFKPLVDIYEVSLEIPVAFYKHIAEMPGGSKMIRLGADMFYVTTVYSSGSGTKHFIREKVALGELCPSTTEAFNDLLDAIKTAKLECESKLFISKATPNVASRYVHAKPKTYVRKKVFEDE